MFVAFTRRYVKEHLLSWSMQGFSNIISMSETMRIVIEPDVLCSRKSKVLESV